MLHLLRHITHTNVSHLIQSVGYIGMFGIIFAETAFFFGFFLPGGSLLFSAGLLASQGYFNVWILATVFGTAATLGDSVAYWIGAKMGPKIFSREDSKFFHKDHVRTTEEFYAKHGAKAVLLGRFVPIIRTFIPLLAGVGHMDYKTFLKYNVLGAIVWAVGTAWLGYALGSRFPGIQKYIFLIILIIILLSLIPLAFEWRKSKKGPPQKSV